MFRTLLGSFFRRAPKARQSCHRRGFLPHCEQLEDRLVPSIDFGITSRLASGQVSTYSGVGFQNLAIAGLIGSDKLGRPDNDPSHYKVSIDWGDYGKPTDASLSFVPGEQFPLVVKGSHTYYLTTS